LPLTLAPGEMGSFLTTGTYTLVATDEGKKANHHYQATGITETSGTPFSLGINVLFRGPGDDPE
jgi:hypothetical protein